MINVTVLRRGAAVRGLVAQQGLGQHSAMTGSSNGGLINCAVALAAAASQFLLSLQLAIAEGIGAVIQPGGSKRDDESIEACDAAGIPMIFTGRRHFKH